MAESTWLFIEYSTATHDTRFTVLPESALINSFGNFMPDRLLAAFQKYAAVLGKVTPTAIIAYEKLPESEARPICDEVTLCYLIAIHGLTFSRRLAATLTCLTSRLGCTAPARRSNWRTPAQWIGSPAAHGRRNRNVGLHWGPMLRIALVQEYYAQCLGELAKSSNRNLLA
jgi:hypothetical protein